jgi:two-component system osmolarity sensor histidine kinase EnvZ
LKLIEGFRRGSLCSRTTVTITLVSSVFFLFTLTVLGYFIAVPIAERSAHELASLVLLSREALHRVAPEKRERLKDHLFEQYELDLSPPPHDLQPRDRHVPFFLLLEEAFQRRLGKQVAIFQSQAQGRENNYWVKLNDHDAGKPLYVGFKYSHKWLDPPEIVLIIAVLGLIATFITGITMARRLTRPLNEIATSARRLGRGAHVEPMAETGPLEIRELVASFNRMSQQLHDLLANRTTLLAGISHDLRTPLTRMELSVEMLKSDEDPSLVSQLQRDIAHMNRLIGLFLEVSRGLQEGKCEPVDISALLDEIASDFRTTGARIAYKPGPACGKLVHPLALRRIIINLLENAIRYGNGTEVELRYGTEPTKSGTFIEVLDRGPGIPQNELKAVFRPFYRLEQSRSSDTGGSGLGLSIVRQLAEANGCHIELLPREGGGTIARLTLVGPTG